MPAPPEARGTAELLHDRQAAPPHLATTAEARPRRLPVTRRRRWLPPLVTALALAGWAVLATAGAPYYRLALAERLHNPWHPVLKPNGTAGLAYGYTGTFLLLLLVSYSARKRWRFLAGLGRLRNWLDVHIFCGILGPAFITMHAGFRFHGLIAIGYWSMLGVMLSGFVGYYLYSQIPRALSGAALEAEALEGEITALDVELQQQGLSPAQLAALRRLAATERAPRVRPLAGLLILLGQDLTMAMGVRRLRLPGRRGRAEARRLHALVVQRLRLERRRAFLRHTESLFGYWHAIHKPFAILLFVMLAVHIGVAFWLGYAWVW